MLHVIKLYKMNKLDITEKVVQLYYELYKAKLIKSKCEFCRIVGINHVIFCQLERGERCVTLEQVCRTINKFNIDSHYFFENGENKTDTI